MISIAMRALREDSSLEKSLVELVDCIGPDMFVLKECHFAVPRLISLCVFLQFMGSGAHYDVIEILMGL